MALLKGLKLIIGVEEDTLKFDLSAICVFEDTSTINKSLPPLLVI
jgi:hypothetical protein